MCVTYAINITFDGDREILWNARTMVRPCVSSSSGGRIIRDNSNRAKWA